MSRQWHYRFNGAQRGPVNEGEIVSLIKNGQIPPNTLVCEVGRMNWQSAQDLSCFQVPPQPVLPSPTASPLHQAAMSIPSSSIGGNSPGNPSSLGGNVPAPNVGAGDSAKGLALGCGGLLVLGLILWGAYNFFFSTLSVEGLGKNVFHALVDRDVDEYMNGCTTWGFSRGKLKKFLMKAVEETANKLVERGEIAVGERDRRLRQMEVKFENEKKYQPPAIEEKAKKVRESFQETIEQGKKDGLNWRKAEFEFVDDSAFRTAKSPGTEEENTANGIGQGDLYLIVSERGKRYKIAIDDCVMVPGYGVLNIGRLIWEGEIR